MSGYNCRWHFNLCAKAYADGDQTRCPWCHVAWSVIESRDFHSCEDLRCWKDANRHRSAIAKDMRIEAVANSGCLTVKTLDVVNALHPLTTDTPLLWAQYRQDPSKTMGAAVAPAPGVVSAGLGLAA